MGLTHFAQLTANGNPLTGDVTLTNVGELDVSTDHIELYEVRFGSRLEMTQHKSGRTQVGHRAILPIRLVKRIDRATPELYQALTTNATIAGDIKIFETAADDGHIRHRFTVTLAGARITAIESHCPDSWLRDTRLPWEQVELIPHTITYADLVHDRAHTDSWSEAV